MSPAILPVNARKRKIVAANSRFPGRRSGQLAAGRKYWPPVRASRSVKRQFNLRASVFYFTTMARLLFAIAFNLEFILREMLTSLRRASDGLLMSSERLVVWQRGDGRSSPGDVLLTFLEQVTICVLESRTERSHGTGGSSRRSGDMRPSDTDASAARFAISSRMLI